ncbi:MAG TPA: hypothetical protein VMU02_05830 [bacterium]|nr:hypothetical protein [bacterium]
MSQNVAAGNVDQPATVLQSVPGSGVVGRTSAGKGPATMQVVTAFMFGLFKQATANGVLGALGILNRILPAGGTTGQVLTKVDGTDYNVDWETPSGGGGGASQPEVLARQWMGM